MDSLAPVTIQLLSLKIGQVNFEFLAGWKLSKTSKFLLVKILPYMVVDRKTDCFIRVFINSKCSINKVGGNVLCNILVTKKLYHITRFITMRGHQNHCISRTNIL